MPVDLSGLPNPDGNKKLIVKNNTSSVLVIGDLRLRLNPSGTPGESIDLYAPIDRTQQRIWSNEKIANSIDLDIAISQRQVSIFNENGELTGQDDKFAISRSANDFSVLEAKEAAENISGPIQKITIDPNQDILNTTDSVLNFSSGSSVGEGFEIQNDNRIVVSEAGKYNIEYSIPFLPNETGERSAFIGKNGIFAPTSTGINTAFKTNIETTRATDTVYFDNKSTMSIANGQTKTVEFWYKPINFGSEAVAGVDANRFFGMILTAFGAFGNSERPGKGINIAQNQDGTLRININNSDNNGFVGAETDEVLTLGKWHHIAFVVQITSFNPTNATVTLYIDGQASSINNTAFNGLVQEVGNGNGSSFAIRVGHDDLVFAIDDIRVSNIGRYSGSSFAVPSTALANDANTEGLWKCNDDPMGTYPLTSETIGNFSLEDSSSNNYDLSLISPTVANLPNPDIEFVAAQAYPADFVERFADVLVPAAANGLPTVLTGTETLELEADDFIQLLAWQNSGTTIQPFTTGRQGKISIQKIG